MSVRQQHATLAIDELVHVASMRERADTPLPPGPKGRRLRNLRSKLLGHPDFVADLYREYGGIAFYRLPHENCCSVSDPDLVAAVLATEDRYFVQGVVAFMKATTLKYRGVQVAHGEEHRWRRALMRPMFSNHLDSWSRAAIEEIVALVDSWRPGDVVALNRAFMQLLSSVLSIVIFGRDMHPDPDVPMHLRNSLKWELISGSLPFGALLRRLPIPAAIRAKRRFAESDGLIFGAIARSRQTSWSGDDLITRLVQAGGDGRERPFTNQEIRDELYWLLGAAMGPPTHSLSWCIDYLAWNPAARLQVEREVAEVLGQATVGVADHGRLPYVGAVFKESLRLAPVVYMIDKVALEDVTLGGYLIPKGTRVFVVPGIVQRMERFFERPEVFSPERWLDGSTAELPEHAYIPYGYGYRVCLGNQFAHRFAVYFLATLAQRWRLQPLAQGPARPDGRVHPMPYRIKGGLRVRVQALT